MSTHGSALRGLAVPFKHVDGGYTWHSRDDDDDDDDDMGDR